MLDFEYPTIPRFDRHILFKLELKGLAISENKVFFEDATHDKKLGFKLDYQYINLEFGDKPHLLMVTPINRKGIPQDVSQSFNDSEKAFAYIEKNIPTHNFSIAHSNVIKHAEKLQNQPPKIAEYTERAEKLTYSLEKDADYYLIDQLNNIMSKSDDYPMDWVSLSTNPTINLYPPNDGYSKIYLRMVSKIELQVSVGEPENDPKSGVIAHPDFKHTHFNTLLATPEDVLNHVNKLMAKLAPKKKVA